MICECGHEQEEHDYLDTEECEVEDCDCGQFIEEEEEDEE